jgi:hypothetical protein
MTAFGNHFTSIVHNVGSESCPSWNRPRPDETISRAVRSARLLAEKGKDTLVVFDTGFLHPSALSNRTLLGYV